MSDRIEELVGGDESGRDVELGNALGLLDPSHGDPNYWLRFTRWVVERAGPELARRRLIADLTVGDVMTSWARAVLPTAALAAALAALLLVRGPVPEGSQLVSIEEMLINEVEGETIPATLSAPESAEGVAFAAEIF